ncbi:MAG: hypothetical protein RBS25_00765, partial [Bacilli bacterium]|nr:hypothetical protein [Bacilli bacterium]
MVKSEKMYFIITALLACFIVALDIIFRIIIKVLAMDVEISSVWTLLFIIITLFNLFALSFQSRLKWYTGICIGLESLPLFSLIYHKLSDEGGQAIPYYDFFLTLLTIEVIF